MAGLSSDLAHAIALLSHIRDACLREGEEAAADHVMVAVRGARKARASLSETPARSVIDGDTGIPEWDAVGQPRRRRGRARATGRRRR